MVITVKPHLKLLNSTLYNMYLCQAHTVILSNTFNSACHALHGTIHIILCFCQLQDADPVEFQVLVNTPDNDFLMSCGIMKSPAVLQFAEKVKIISDVCLHSSVLSTLAELEELRRGLQTAKFSLLMEQHPA